MILQKNILNFIELISPIPNYKSLWIIDKQKRLSVFLLSIWLWKPALIGSKIEKRSTKKSWHFGTHVMKRSFVLKRLWCTLYIQPTRLVFHEKKSIIWGQFPAIDLFCHACYKNFESEHSFFFLFSIQAKLKVRKCQKKMFFLISALTSKKWPNKISTLLY